MRELLVPELQHACMHSALLLRESLQETLGQGVTAAILSTVTGERASISYNESRAQSLGTWPLVGPARTPDLSTLESSKELPCLTEIKVRNDQALK
jgi:hypothetical protein